MEITRPRNNADLLAGVDKPINKSSVYARSTLEICYQDGSIALRYHDTDVATKLPNGTYQLDSGGFRTATTKARINYWTPAGIGIYQEKSIWYMRDGNVFYDGIVVNSDGNVISEKQIPVEKHKKEVEKKKRRIRKYVQLIDAEKHMPTPSAGDCWLCCMRSKKTEESWGADNHDHLESHIDAGYMFGSIIYNAMVEAGHHKPELYWQMNLKDAPKRALRKYLYKRLLPEIAA